MSFNLNLINHLQEDTKPFKIFKMTPEQELVKIFEIKEQILFLIRDLFQ